LEKEQALLHALETNRTSSVKRDSSLKTVTPVHKSRDERHGRQKFKRQRATESCARPLPASHRVQGLAPIATASCRTLILGSLPGAASVQAQRYYAHPQNAFWKIMRNFLRVDLNADEGTTIAAFLAQQLALWDVYAEADRIGSLDSAIHKASAATNDIAGFIESHPELDRVLLNGGLAHDAFRRVIWPALAAAQQQRLQIVALPSTSPANAGLSFADKQARWLGALAR
jgi:double-stranded uracil-DNA glycosylase